MAYFLPSPSFSTLPCMTAPAFVNGLELNVVSTTEFTINPGAARDLVSDYIIAYNPLQNGGDSVITVDVTRRGMNGCYPFLPSEKNASGKVVYPVYIVANKSGTPSGSRSSDINPGIIVATGDEFLPPGMNAFRRIGWIYIDQANLNTINAWAQSGSGNQRTYTLAEPRSRLRNAGQTVYTSISMTSASGIVPPKQNVTVLLNVFTSAVTAGEGAFFSYTDLETGRVGTAYVLSPVAGQNIGVPLQMVAGQDPVTKDSIVYYKVSAAGNLVSIDNSGFVDELSNTLY